MERNSRRRIADKRVRVKLFICLQTTTSPAQVALVVFFRINNLLRWAISLWYPNCVSYKQFIDILAKLLKFCELEYLMKVVFYYKCVNNLIYTGNFKHQSSKNGFKNSWHFYSLCVKKRFILVWEIL